jgi:hypothetical protein
VPDAAAGVEFGDGDDFRVRTAAEIRAEIEADNAEPIMFDRRRDPPRPQSRPGDLHQGRVHSFVKRGHERRDGCNDRKRGSRRSRSGSRTGSSSDDSDGDGDNAQPPGVSYPPARRQTAEVAS